MIVINNNDRLHIHSITKMSKDKTYLVVTRSKQLYVVKQTGARSWDAFNMDFDADLKEHIHGSKNDILGRVNNALDVDYVIETYNKTDFRKCIMEFQLLGEIGSELGFTAEKRKA